MVQLSDAKESNVNTENQSRVKGLPSTVDSKLFSCLPSTLVHCCFVSFALHDDREGWEGGPGTFVDIGVPGASHSVA